MNVFIFDNTLDGLYSCVFYSYKNKIIPDDVVSDCTQLDMCSVMHNVKTEDDKCLRVKKAVVKYGGKITSKRIKDCFKSKEENKNKIIFDYIRLIVDTQKDNYDNYFDDASRNFIYTLDKVYSEVHLIEGFLRFKETDTGVFYAPYAPDNDITELLLPHFSARYKNMPFVIHDYKRNVLGIYDGSKYKTVQGEGTVTVYLSDKQEEFEKLWKTYYYSVNITERKNERQMTNYMPRRYWKDLPEKKEPPDGF